MRNREQQRLLHELVQDHKYLVKGKTPNVCWLNGKEYVIRGTRPYEMRKDGVPWNMKHPARWSER